MSTNLKLGICLPTNNYNQLMNGPGKNPDPSRSWLATMCDGSMDAILPHSVILINFNPPFTEEQANQVVTTLVDYGWEVRTTWTSGWDAPIKFINIRKACAALGNDCDIFQLADDDMVFVKGTDVQHKSSGEKYLDMLQYFENNPKCGIINCKGFLGGYHQKNHIVPSYDDMYSTNRGSMFRNMSKVTDWSLCPPNEFRGALEETYLTYVRLELGFYPAKSMNCPTIHPAERLDEELPETDMHHPKVLAENVQKWVRERYEDETWEYEQKRIPRSNHLKPGLGEYNAVSKSESKGILDFGGYGNAE